MALGGGTFVTQNKALPGAYINFVSAARASATLADRGVGAIALELDWGKENEIMEITSGDLQKNSLELFGYDYSAKELMPLRELMLNLTTLYVYRLNGGGVKASNTYAEALYSGTRGNAITIVIEANGEKYDVVTMFEGREADRQTVSTAGELTANDWVTFKSDASLEATAGTPLTGGTNGTVETADHQAFLDKAESYSFNATGYAGTDDSVKSLYVAYTKRMRDEVGAKFQCVVYNKAADYEGVVNVKNSVSGDNEAAIVYWVTGIIGGCAVNKSNLNKVYDGELEVNADYTQSELEAAIEAGEFTLHKVGSDIRVLYDINSLTTVSDTKGDVFKSNQTIRVCDQIANDIATIFNTRYLGTVPNDNAGRISLWNDIVKHHEQLMDIRAIEDFEEDDITVAMGDAKDSVVVTDAISVVNAMAKLYMTITVA